MSALLSIREDETVFNVLTIYLWRIQLGFSRAVLYPETTCQKLKFPLGIVHCTTPLAMGNKINVLERKYLNPLPHNSDFNPFPIHKF